LWIGVGASRRRAEHQEIVIAVITTHLFHHLDLNERVTGGGRSSAISRRKDYAAVLDNVKDLAQRYTGWEGLQWLATQSARGGRDWSSAVEFSGNLKRLANTGNDLEQ
jgi:hypothetical protein